MKRAEPSARKDFVTKQVDNKVVNDDAMLGFTSSSEKSSLIAGDDDAPTDSASTLTSTYFQCPFVVLSQKWGPHGAHLR